jgi:ubiquinone/menaquinone biosynthesis C-methylase UbiE
MANDGNFWNSIAAKYAKSPVADPASYEKKLAVTRDYMTPDMEVLEIGCGTGSTAIHHAPAVKHIRATDLSPAMLDIARSRAAAAGVTNTTFEVCAIDDLDAPDASVDMVMAHSILHLVTDRDAVLAKLFRMLKPGGVLVSSTVCIGDSMVARVLVPLIAPIGRMVGKFPDTLRIFTGKQLAESITQAGFRIDHEWRPGPTKAMFIVAKKS